ncbi:MAG: transaldolase family protein [Myxococcota bacterium]
MTTTPRTELATESTDLGLLDRHPIAHVDLRCARVAAAAERPDHEALVEEAVAWAQQQVGRGGNRKLVGVLAGDRFQLLLAAALQRRVGGDVSVEVDPRLAHKRRAAIDKAREMLRQLEEIGADPTRVLLKLPATWEGIEAARKLREKNGARCHIALVFGRHQLAAAAQAGAALVTFSVGRITDFHEKRDDGGVLADDGAWPDGEDPGVAVVRRMRGYLARHHPEVMTMGDAFRGLSQVVALSDTVERLCLPPPLLEAWGHVGDDHPAETPSVSDHAAEDEQEGLPAIDAGTFRRLHDADRLARTKTRSSVQNLSWAAVSRERRLLDWITRRQDVAAERTTLALFRTWDYDGDGFIDREEWAGTDEVFNALDRDDDGRISLEEMALGLGAPVAAAPASDGDDDKDNDGGRTR